MSYAYYRWFPGDYQRDTMHLGWHEDLAYRRLIDLYNTSGKPLRNDRAYILRAVRATEPEQQQAVDNVLAEFFQLKADGWHQTRCDAEVRYRSGIDAHAQRAANARWERHRKTVTESDKLDAHAMRSDSGRITNQNQNQNQNQKSSGLSITPNSNQPRNTRAAPAALTLPDWIPQEHWNAWIEARVKRRNPPTPFALRLAVTKLDALREDGHQPSAVLAQSAFRGWAGLFPVKEDR